MPSLLLKCLKTGRKRKLHIIYSSVAELQSLILQPLVTCLCVGQQTPRIHLSISLSICVYITRNARKRSKLKTSAAEKRISVYLKSKLWKEICQQHHISLGLFARQWLHSVSSS